MPKGERSTIHYPLYVFTGTDMCIKRTASAFSVNWIIPRKNFKITKGKSPEARV
jgi:hypothetical protein